MADYSNFDSFKKPKLNDFELKCLEKTLNIHASLVDFSRYSSKVSQVVAYEVVLSFKDIKIRSYNWLDTEDDVDFYEFRELLIEDINNFHNTFLNGNYLLQKKYLKDNFSYFFKKEINKINAILNVDIAINSLHYHFIDKFEESDNYIEAYKYIFDNFHIILDKYLM